MTKIKVSFAAILGCFLATISLTSFKPKADMGLKEALKDKFLIGVAMNTAQITGRDSVSDNLIVKHFNSIVAENCMKNEVVQPIEGKFDFSLADKFVEFGEKHHMFIIGHTLVWHSQAARWFFVDQKGSPVSREVLIERMKNHIMTVVKRYKGRVKGWDVVNEAINDDGTMRETPFYKIIGKEYIKLAFQFAHEADPKAELYYNDYSMAKVSKREAVVKMINELQKEGVNVAAIGMQGHFTMDFPTVEDEEKSIEAFAELGTKVMITEMDMGVLPLPDKKMGAEISRNFHYDSAMNPYAKSLPDSVATAQHDRFAAFFKMFIKHKAQISRVTLWGITDKYSWRNNWPIMGRTDYPLLFDRNFTAKPIVETIIKEALKK
jgi:endo-1,4-beta-xylanase